MSETFTGLDGFTYEVLPVRQRTMTLFICQRESDVCGTYAIHHDGKIGASLFPVLRDTLGTRTAVSSSLWTTRQGVGIGHALTLLGFEEMSRRGDYSIEPFTTQGLALVSIFQRHGYTQADATIDCVARTYWSTVRHCDVPLVKTLVRDWSEPRRTIAQRVS